MARKFGTIDRIEWQAPKEAAPTTASSVIVAENEDRAGLLIVNDGAVNIYLSIGVQAQNGKGIFLAASGGSYEMNSTNLSTQAVHAIAASGTGSIAFQEAI